MTSRHPLNVYSTSERITHILSLRKKITRSRPFFATAFAHTHRSAPRGRMF